MVNPALTHEHCSGFGWGTTFLPGLSFLLRSLLSMRFAYLPVTVRRPVYPLGGSTIRHYPVFSVAVGGPSGEWSRDCLVDSAADDTIFPITVARKVGIDLSNAPVGEARQVGGVILSYRYAQVTLRISDGLETCEWPAIVGFLDQPMRWALLGQTGFFQFLDVHLRGGRREVILTPDVAFPGQHIVH
jgi:hypothetical protein